MKRYLLGLFCGIGLLTACTASKLKSVNNRSANTAHTIYSDSSFTNTYLGRAARSNQSSYNAIWWLKGNVRFRLDSGLSADEAWVQLRGQQLFAAQQMDSSQYHLQQVSAAQQLSTEQWQKTQKTKNNQLNLPWWAYLILASGLAIMCYRLSRR